jgi:hypothetical protein
MRFQLAHGVALAYAVAYSKPVEDGVVLALGQRAA